jgi:drug/metabolite transporter (DMT)-like permease
LRAVASTLFGAADETMERRGLTALWGLTPFMSETASRDKASELESVSSEPIVPPIVGLVLAIVAISSGAILVRLSTEAPSVVAFYRVLFTTLPLIPIAAWKYRDDFRRITGRDLVFAALAGIALAIHFASWFESLEWTSVAASVTLVQSQPIFVAAGAWLLLRERVTDRMVLGIIVAVVGMVTMSIADLLSGVLVGPNPLYGNTLAIVGAIMAAGYVLAGRSLRQRVALIPYVVIVYSVCTLALLVLVLAEGHPLTGYPAREWLIFVGLALGPGLFGHTVINWALGYLESSVVSVSMLGEPIGATILALVILGEIPTQFTLVGGAIVLAGIYVTASDRRTASS